MDSGSVNYRFGQNHIDYLFPIPVGSIEVKF